MSRGTSVLTEARALAGEIQAAMDRAEQNHRVPESIERWCALRDARIDVLAAAGRGVIGLAVFGSEELEHQSAEKALRDDLPAAIDRARLVLLQEGVS